MAKAGSAYNELASRMAEALEPQATVRMGQWVEGPDGKREVDVEVRGSADGKPFFLLVERKDWKQPVDIEEIDKLDSKRRDLSADRVMICSNSGFTRKALRKASRLEIGAVSVVANGNQLVKLKVMREYFAKAISADHWYLNVFPTDSSVANLPAVWNPTDLFFEGQPVVNWLHKISEKLLREHEGATGIIATFAFSRELAFSLQGAAVTLRGLQLNIDCSRKWVAQTVQEDVTIGYFDWVRQRMTVPAKEHWTLGPIDRLAWKEIEVEPGGYDEDLEPGTLRLEMTLLRPIAQLDGLPAPDLDSFVGEMRVTPI